MDACVVRNDEETFVICVFSVWQVSQGGRSETVDLLCSYLFAILCLLIRTACELLPVFVPFVTQILLVSQRWGCLVVVTSHLMSHVNHKCWMMRLHKLFLVYNMLQMYKNNKCCARILKIRCCLSIRSLLFTSKNRMQFIEPFIY